MWKKSSWRRALFISLILFPAYLAHPDWTTSLVSTVKPSFQFSPGYLYMVIGLVGTTIAPWMQFYLQSAVVEKGVKIKDYIYSRMDVIVGCIMTDVVAFFIIVACAATIYITGHRDIKDAGDAAMALRPLAGHAASALFALGLCQCVALFRLHSALWPRPTTFAKDWDWNQESTNSLKKPRLSIGYTLA